MLCENHGTSLKRLIQGMRTSVRGNRAFRWEFQPTESVNCLRNNLENRNTCSGHGRTAKARREPQLQTVGK
jgi:hypothetical protein